MKTFKKIGLAVAALVLLFGPAAIAQTSVVTNITGCLDCGYPDGATFSYADTFGGTVTFNGATVFTGGQTLNKLTLANGGLVEGDTTTAHTWGLAAYDNTSSLYRTFETYTNGNTATLAIAAPTHGTISIDGATIGATTPLAGTFTALTAKNTTNQLTLGAAAHTLVLSSTAPSAASQTLTLPDPGGADSVAYLALAQTFTGTETFGAASSIVSKTSTSATDINPPFDNRILGNPVLKLVYGSCSVASVNGGTCIPLAGVTARTITVTSYDIVAAGSAATCTGVFLEDTNGTPVVISTIAAAALTSGAHNFQGIANNVLGVGFGAGSGLTAAKGVQLIKNGSDCGTTTAFQYAITYTVQ